MKTKTRFFLVEVLFLLLFTKVNAQSNGVFISEVFYDTPFNERIATSKPYSNGEFIEFYNSSSVDVDLSGWILKGGGKTELFIFPSNAIIKAYSYCVVAYRHYDTPSYNLSDLFQELVLEDANSVFYQRRIILKNSGEPITLRKPDQNLVDSLYYEGTSHKRRKDRLFATNDDNVKGNQCVSIQRTKATLNIDGAINIDRADFTAAVATPLAGNINIQRIEGLSFTYDNSGNRILKQPIKCIVLKPKPNKILRKKAPRVTKNEFQTDLLDDKKITIYPNPTKGKVYVQFTDLDREQINQIQLFTSSGRLIKNIDFHENLVEIDLESQNKGLYLMVIRLGNEKTTWKIIKE